MEHIVQFGIGIDDDAIIKNVMNHAEKSIIKDLKNEIKSGIEREIFMIDRGWTGEERKLGLHEWVKDLVVKILEDNKNDIIEMAAERLADRMSRSKAIKEEFVNTFKDAVAE